MAIERTDMLRWPKKMKTTSGRRNMEKYCRFHKDHGHDTEDCIQLRDEIERLIQQGYLQNFVLKEERGQNQEEDNLPRRGVIHMIAGGPSGGDSQSARRKHARNLTHDSKRKLKVMCVQNSSPITFDGRDLAGVEAGQNDPMVITMDIGNFAVQKVLVDNGSSTDILFMHVLRKMELDVTASRPVDTPLMGFGGSEVVPLGTIDLPTSLGEAPCRKTIMIKYLVVEAPFAYNVIMGRPGLNQFQAVVSTYHLKMKFPTTGGVGEVRGDQKTARECYNVSLKKKKEGREVRTIKQITREEEVGE
ncbi:hypothetical protein DH2020_028349 [Rehmannia glutinosa]|uniref:Reverse transcriptase domain-containing protein n=1 Tax=Rehmannia glutinosa TaxID=99300 RepID=A0ABR0VUL3_REHGL